MKGEESSGEKNAAQRNSKAAEEEKRKRKTKRSLMRAENEVLWRPGE